MGDREIELIKALGPYAAGIITAIGAVWAKNRIRPNRSEGIYDGYDRFIKQLERDLDRKGQQVDALQALLDKQRQQNEETQELLDKMRDELEESKRQNQSLTEQLAALRQRTNQ